MASCFIGCCNFPSAVGFSNCIAYVIGLMTTVTLKKVVLSTDVQSVPKDHYF